MSGLGRPTHTGHGIVCLLELPDGTRLRATAHCVDRFWERGAASCADFKSAKERLRILVSQIGRFEEPPDWYPSEVHGRYVALGDSLGLIVDRDVAKTAIARGTYSPQRRQRRNETRRIVRQMRAKRRGR